MKKIAMFLMGIITVFIVEGCTDKNDGDAKTVVRIASQPYPFYSQLFVAKHLGILEEELKNVNATFTWAEFKGGPLVNEAVASGNADIGMMGDMPAILAKSSGQDILFFTHMTYGERALALVVKTDSPIQDVKEIKGKKVAYVKGSNAQHLLAILLDNAGLTFNDIVSINLGMSDIPAAIESGDIDAAVAWEQYVSSMVADGKVRVIVDGTGLKRGNNVSYTVRSFAQKHPEVLVAYIKAVQRGSDYINSHPKEAAVLISKNFGIKPDILEIVFNNFVYYASFTEEDIAEIKRVKDYIFAEKIIKNDVNIDELITTKYLKEAGL
ncbi:MAG: aliphatic sulfonate ABC transporter substrate-binding protein [Campylobacteraceae bacterium]|jgi:sulfonate transport system substrate-binding protein|nr:aliphatic sulfonate ABC transporter substrate-binding protein [Campylobacteraceae bacterium]